MLVYCTKTFAERLKQLKMEKKFSEIVQAVKQAKAVPRLIDAGLEPYHGLWVKKLGGQGTTNQIRMLACVINLQQYNVPVVCFFALFQRSDKEYNQMRQLVEQGSYSPPVSKEEVAAWYESESQHAEIRTEGLPEIEDMHRVWFQPLGGSTKPADEAVYESVEWCTRSRDSDIKPFWQTYYNLVSDVIQDTAIGREVEVDGVTLRYHHDGERGILFKRYDFEGRSQVLLLAQLAPNHDLKYEASKLNSALQIEQISSCDDIARVCRKAYPYYILADDKLWHDIQEDETANLALSAEEENLLSAVLVEPSGLPLFINGRAGSGKSTMLYYLFARYLERSIELRCPEKLIFLTYSEPLLRLAKDSVHHILLSQARQKNSSLPLNKFDEIIEQCFQPFQRLLLNIAREHTGADQTTQQPLFALDRYVSFHTFKQLLSRECKIPEKNQFSPETIWHVVRTYIKGYRVGDFLSPEEYEEIPRDEKTVDMDTYKTVFEKIWSWYKKLQADRQLWDDQDLVRYVLGLDTESVPWFVAIFCDEVQDFTRIEFQVLFKLSAASRFEVPPESHNLPFAFAGDPLQTISPTGFRWEALKAAFYNNVLAPIGILGDRYSLKERELEYNYRSTPEVTHFANLVQLWRSVIFGRSSVRPQKPWQVTRGPAVGLYIIDKDISAAQFAESVQKKEYTIIVPCEPGGEADFIRQDDVLGRLEDIANIWSPSSAKGLEFRQVFIYKFGDHCTVNFENRQTNDVREEYFFNKLYVAVTRARERLYIVDTERGYSKLWKYFTKSAYTTLLQNEPVGFKWQEDDLQTFVQGLPAEVIEADKPIEIADQLRVKGEQSEDPSLLLRASEYYALIGDNLQATQCKARAEYFLGNYASAGKLYTEIGRYQDAFESYWQGRAWNEAHGLLQKHAVGNDLQREIVNIMAIDSEADFVEQAVTLIDANIHDMSQYPQHLADIAQRYMRAINYIEGYTPQPSKEQWERRGDCAMRMASITAINFETRKGLNHTAFTCFCRAQSWKLAVEAAGRAGIRDGQEYFEARAYAEEMPAGLQWLVRLRDGDARILREWEKAGKPINKEWARYLLRPLENEQRYVDLARVCQEIGEPERILEVLNDAVLSERIKEDGLMQVVGALQELPIWYSMVEKVSVEGKYDSLRQNLITFLSNSTLVSPPEKDVDDNKRRLRLSYVRLVEKTLAHMPTDMELLSRLFMAAQALGARDETCRAAYMLLRQYDISSPEFTSILSDIDAGNLLGHMVQLMADEVADSAEASAKLLRHVVEYPQSEGTLHLRGFVSSVEQMIKSLIESTQWKVYASADELFSAYTVLQENHIDALRYLEAFTEHQEKEIQDSARRCWLEVKNRQIAYHENKGDHASARKSQAELHRRMKDWGMQPPVAEPTQLEAVRFFWLVDGDATFDEDDEAFYTSLGHIGLRLLKKRKKMIIVNATSFAYHVVDMVEPAEPSASPLWGIVYIESEKRGRYTIKVHDRIVRVTTRRKQIRPQSP